MEATAWLESWTAAGSEESAQ
uniref:Uncharacterized protein n=1 Tax=Arundo donax TaxID=35708 RepID=A0A0A9CB99_ARUDO